MAVGPDRALDSPNFFLGATELFGTAFFSPAILGAVSRPALPGNTIRDNVEAVHRLPRGIENHALRASSVFHGRAAGLSVGSELPGFADRIVATSGTAKTYPQAWCGSKDRSPRLR